MVSEKSLANLKSFGTMSPEEEREIKLKGQKKSVEKRNENNQIRKCLEMLRDMSMPKEKCAEMGLPEDTTYAMGAAKAMFDGAMEKNPAMAKALLEALGELKNEININGSMPVVIHDDID